MTKFTDLPKTESCRLIDFEKVEIQCDSATKKCTLIVSGIAPCVNMRVDLIPRVYITQPEYWGIEVVGCLSGGICLTALRPYVAIISLEGITGTKGIEVIGATRSEKREVPPKKKG